MSFCDFCFLTPFIKLTFMCISNIVITNDVPTITTRHRYLKLRTKQRKGIIRVSKDIIYRVVISRYQVRRPCFLPFVVHRRRVPFHVKLRKVTNGTIITQATITKYPTMTIRLLMVFQNNVLLFVGTSRSILITYRGRPILCHRNLYLRCKTTPLPITCTNRMKRFQRPRCVSTQLTFNRVRPITQQSSNLCLASRALLPTIILPTLRNPRPFAFLCARRRRTTTYLSSIYSRGNVPRVDSNVENRVLNHFRARNFHVGRLHHLVQMVPMAIVVPISFSFPISSTKDKKMTTSFVRNSFTTLYHRSSKRRGRSVDMCFRIILAVLCECVFVSTRS